MTAWGDKKVGDVRTRTYVLPGKMLARGITITAVGTVVVTVLESSTVVDPSPMSLLNGANGGAQSNPATIVDGFKTIGINQAILLSLKAGVIDCTYVVTLAITLSTGETIFRDCIQYVAKYVPNPALGCAA